MRHNLLIMLRIVCFWFFLVPMASAIDDQSQEPLPELGEVQAIADMATPHEGVLFVIYEYDTDAIEWIVPRLSHYVALLRARHKDLPIAVVSHGDELLALTSEQRLIYPAAHEQVRAMIEQMQVDFHVCGAYASFNGYGPQDFPDYIDVVPFGPAQIADYRDLGYALIELDLTW